MYQDVIPAPTDRAGEFYFRIVHIAQGGHNGAPVAPYREQTVEIALGPKLAFKNGKIGTPMP